VPVVCCAELPVDGDELFEEGFHTEVSHPAGEGSEAVHSRRQGIGDVQGPEAETEVEELLLVLHHGTSSIGEFHVQGSAQSVGEQALSQGGVYFEVYDLPQMV